MAATSNDWVNKVAQKDTQKYIRDLYWALRTRVLTDEEMEEVEGYGYTITVDTGQTYYEHEKQIEFQNALLNQFKMREIARKG